MQRWHKLVALVVGVAVLAGAGATTRAADAAPSASAPIQVGVVYSRTGLLASYGAQYIQGLRYGLAYATKGTNAVNGRKIELSLVDDATDPVKAVAGAKDLIGKGYKVIIGTAFVGHRGPAGPARRAEQGPVHLRAGRERRGHRHQPLHLPLGPPELPGCPRGELLPRRRRRQERHRVRPGLRLRARQLPRRAAGDGEPRRAEGEPDSRAALGAGLHAVRAADQAAEDRPPVRRVGRHDGPRDVARARAAGHLPGRRQGRDGPRPAVDLPDVRPGRLEHLVHLALRLQRPEEQGERLPRPLDAEAQPGARTCSRRTGSSPGRCSSVP